MPAVTFTLAGKEFVLEAEDYVIQVSRLTAARGAAELSPVTYVVGLEVGVLYALAYEQQSKEVSLGKTKFTYFFLFISSPPHGIHLFFHLRETSGRSSFRDTVNAWEPIPRPVCQLGSPVRVPGDTGN